MAASVPSGTVTFLFTDIEGSTRLWDQHGDEMNAALTPSELDARIEATGEMTAGEVRRFIFERL